MACNSCSKPGVLVFERGDVVTIQKVWPAAAVTPSDVWRFQIRYIDSWIEDADDTRLFWEGPMSVVDDTDPENVGGKIISTVLPADKSETVKFDAHFGLRVTNDDGSKTVERGLVKPWVSPVEPGAGPVAP